MSRSTGKLLSALLATAVVSAMVAPASAVVNIIDNPGALSTDGVAGTSEYRYVVSAPGTLSRDDAASLSARVLTNSTETGGGNAASPGGNVELGVADTAQQALDWHAGTLPVVTLTGKLGTADVSLRSLTAADWFAGGSSTAYGNSDLANTWFNDLLAYYGLDVQPDANKQLVFNAFVAQDGFFRLSDPNISYVYRDADLDTVPSTVHVGVAGTVNGNGPDSPNMATIAAGAVNAAFDAQVAQVNAALAAQIAAINAGPGTAGQKAAAIAAAQAAANNAIAAINVERNATLALIPSTLAASEVVIASYTGLGEQVLYGFSYTGSGLATDDNTRSYDANFDLVFEVPAGDGGGDPAIPEPMTAGLMGLAIAGLATKAFGRRRA